MLHVERLGWTEAALRAGAQDLGLSPAAAGMAQRGAAELVEHHVRSLNREFARRFAGAAPELRALPTPLQLSRALRARLEMNIPHIGNWPQALALMSRPSNSPAAAALLTELVDDVWHMVGDRSVDTTWYTKRGALAAVYVAMDLYMLTDTSPGFSDTWEALERRIADMETAGDLLWGGGASARSNPGEPEQPRGTG